MIHWLLSKWAMWFSLLHQSTWRCLPSTYRQNPTTKGFHLRDVIPGLGEPELRPLKLKVTSQPFCFPTSDSRSQRKKKSRLARGETALPFHQRTKRFPKEKRKNTNPQKFLTWIQKHQKGKEKKKSRSLHCEDTSTAWKAWKKWMKKI